MITIKKNALLKSVKRKLKRKNINENIDTFYFSIYWYFHKKYDIILLHQDIDEVLHFIDFVKNTIDSQKLKAYLLQDHELDLSITEIGYVWAKIKEFKIKSL
jgi:hypothetical protein